MGHFCVKPIIRCKDNKNFFHFPQHKSEFKIQNSKFKIQNGKLADYRLFVKGLRVLKAPKTPITPIDGRRSTVDGKRKKKRKVCGKCKAHKKADPQFTNVNEEPAYRSVTQQLPCNLRFSSFFIRSQRPRRGLFLRRRPQLAGRSGCSPRWLRGP